MEKILSSPNFPRIPFLFFVINAKRRICWLNLPPGHGPEGERLLNAQVSSEDVIPRVRLCVQIKMVVFIQMP